MEKIEDGLIHSYEDQKELFIKTVQKYVRVRKELIKKVCKNTSINTIKKY